MARRSRGGAATTTTIFYLIAALSIILLTLLPSLTSASPTSASPTTRPHFEGFDAEDGDGDVDVDGDEDLSSLSDDLDSRPTLRPTTTLSTSDDPPQSTTPAAAPASSSPSDSLSSFEYWDDDEFEGLPQPEITSPPATPSDSETAPVSEPEISPSATATTPKGLRDYTTEIVCVSFLIMFAINYFTGKKENENLALSWAIRFAGKDSIFDKNFSLLGVGEGDDSPLLLKEGQTLFKFYASGRRFCQGMLATLDLKSRHDLIARLYNSVVPCKDEITFEVFLNDDAMDHVVFALARKKLAKSMQKEVRDLQRFGSLVTPSSGRKWVADELAVVAESKEVAGDLITEAVLDQVFGDKAFANFGKYFISMHFSDQHSGSHKKMLEFKFALPDANHLADMTRLVALIPYYIDLIGRYKLSSHARSKTEAARLKVAQEIHKELLNARQEELKRRKAEQRKKMEEGDAKLSAEALRKKEAKERARQMKKGAPKMKMTRAH